MPNAVRIRKRKFDKRVMWDWDGDLVEKTDDWLVVYHGVGRHVRKTHGVKAGAPAPYALSYISTGRPLLITVFFDEHGDVEHFKCDAGLPATVEGKLIEFIDLDLDLVVSPSLTYFRRDEEDLARNGNGMEYTPEAMAAAREGIRLATSLVEKNREPFDGSARRLLGTVLSARRPL